MIDFTLSNCTNSRIKTIGILAQYKPADLHLHIGKGESWLAGKNEGEISLLLPSQANRAAFGYKGTANAVFQNKHFLDKHDQEYVLILSGDHIYRMDYSLMLEHHKKTKAEATIAVTSVKWEETSRFGIMTTDHDGRIVQFEEKPTFPQSNLASMGAYIFNRSFLEAFLSQDEDKPESSHDFGHDLIPEMLKCGANLYAYSYNGYWRDIGTIKSLWEAHMDLLSDSQFQTWNTVDWPIYTRETGKSIPPMLLHAKIRNSIINDCSLIEGEVDRSLVSYGARIGEGSLVQDSVIMPNAQIGKNVMIQKAIIGEGAIVRDGVCLGNPEGEQIIVVGPKEIIGQEMVKTKLEQIFSIV